MEQYFNSTPCLFNVTMLEITCQTVEPIVVSLKSKPSNASHTLHAWLSFLFALKSHPPDQKSDVVEVADGLIPTLSEITIPSIHEID